MQNNSWEKLINSQRGCSLASVFDQSIRHERLMTLRSMIVDNESLLLEALHKDLGKPAFEAYASEIALTLNEIDFLLKHHGHYLRDRIAFFRPWQKARVRYQPFGCVLILSPWNYPLQLALSPLAGALAAGNCCVLKPSEISVHTSSLLADLISKYFEENVVKAIEGDGQLASELLQQQWDFVFFTGSEKIGQIVARSAARHLTPSVLELGGKCPCIVDKNSVDDRTARSIIWAKLFNTGQTCIAPDHVWVEESALEPLISKLTEQIRLMYGSNPAESPDYGRIISKKHFDRLYSMLDQGTIRSGGSCDRASLYIEPTIITNPDMSGSLLQEEIFGPILPVLPYKDHTSLLEELKSRPAPLAVYAFCGNDQLADKLEKQVSSGAFVRNTLLEQAARPQLPFGGTGSSGYGRYHGFASLEAFSYQKIIINHSRSFDLELKYPPYQNKYLKLMRRLRRWLP